MPLLEVIGVLLLVGVLLWAVTAFPYLDSGIKRLIQIVVVVVAAIWVISLFLPMGHLSTLHVGR